MCSRQGAPAYALLQAFELEGALATAGFGLLLTGKFLAGENAQKISALTAREKQVLRLIGLGAKNQDIAKELSISIETVETHRKAVIRKLGAGSVVDLVRYADAMREVE